MPWFWVLELLKGHNERADEKMALERAKALNDMSIYEEYLREKESRRRSASKTETIISAILIIGAILFAIIVLLLVKL